MASISKRTSGAWQNTSYGIRATATDTITTLPTTIYGDGTNATISAKGNTVQNGTLTSDNPIMPEGTGERTGNLWDRNVPRYEYAKDYKKYNPDSAIALKAGTYTISSDNKLPIIQVFDVNHTQLNADGAITHTSGYQIIWDGLAIGPQTNGIREITITLLADYILTFAVDGNLGTYIMLNTGSTALPYEPFGVKIPILSAGQTTPIYLGETQTTRRIKKLVLDGTENWRLYALSGATNVERFYFAVSKNTVSPGSIISSHFPTLTDNSDTEHIRCGGSPINEIYIYISRSVATTVADLKAWLAAQYAAGTPVCVWYVLATEETAVVNEPLMKIDDYADEISGVSIPTTDGASTLSVDTTVQPSEVSVNYHGWHMGAVHERTSGQWD